jgi:hypothetical protein
LVKSKNRESERGRIGIKTVLEDANVNVKVKISALWAALMFFYIYADILAFYQPGHITAAVSGQIAGMQINQAFLMSSAIIMAIPSIMVFLSLSLKANANRLANLILGVLYAGILLVTNALVAAEVGGFHILQASIEAVLLALIVWHAWKWPKVEGKP